MLPGVYENGGIYNHAGCFKVMADCALGRAEEAYASLGAIVPDGPRNPSEKTTVEPYVFVNCYLKHPAADMKCGPSWQTGTSAWGLRCYYEGMLGIRREYAGAAHFALPAFRMGGGVRRTRLPRQPPADLLIKPAAGGVRIRIDGAWAAGQLVPPFADRRRTHHRSGILKRSTISCSNFTVRKRLCGNIFCRFA